ncbi:hypothetical protein CEXT_129821 [Caerostris extrusa]|uniref:Uncharacterized protein n=1 Tax=Caerostris extrusa TaxID=172846 RepID=A0AAV4P2X4_CAEEX|nr:hypothetical protein CEXT_129821 [Caerostris extrusa]
MIEKEPNKNIPQHCNSSGTSGKKKRNQEVVRKEYIKIFFPSRKGEDHLSWEVCVRIFLPFSCSPETAWVRKTADPKKESQDADRLLLLLLLLLFLLVSLWD